MIAQVEFDLAYFGVAVQCVRHNDSDTLQHVSIFIYLMRN